MPKPKEIKSDKKLDFDISGKKITVNGENLKVVVDDGKVVSYVIDEKELLKAPLEPNYFRALTDNDIDFLNFTPQWAKFHPFYAWQRATHHTKAVKTEVVKNGEVVEIHIAFQQPALKIQLQLTRYILTENFMYSTVQYLLKECFDSATK